MVRRPQVIDSDTSCCGGLAPIYPCAGKRSTSVPPQAQFAAQLGIAQNQDFHGQFSHIVPMRSNASPSGTDGIRSTARLYECCAPGIRMVTNASAANCLMEQRPPYQLGDRKSTRLNSSHA